VRSRAAPGTKPPASPKWILLLALSFLFVRNLPLCFLMPIWSFGDELAHLDYVLKISRGHVPQPEEFIEPELFEFHREHAVPPGSVARVEDMGPGGHSYEAFQPLLPAYLLSFPRRLFVLLGLPLLLQVRLLRVVCLLVAAATLTAFSFGLEKLNIRGIPAHSPVLFAALLAQDIYFCINTDVFSLFFGSLAGLGMIAIFQDPARILRWLGFSLATALSLWTKLTNAYVFLYWPVLAAGLWIRGRDGKTLRRASVFLAAALLLACPWYVYNQARFGSPIIDPSNADFPLLPPRHVSTGSLVFFFRAFFLTFFRGELFRDGRHFDPAAGTLYDTAMFIIPATILLLAVAALIRPRRTVQPDSLIVPAVCGLAAYGAFYSAYALIGGVPFYHARRAAGAHILFLLLFSIGWRKLIPHDRLAIAVPAAILLAYNILYTWKLVALIRV